MYAARIQYEDRMTRKALVSSAWPYIYVPRRRLTLKARQGTAAQRLCHQLDGAEAVAPALSQAHTEFKQGDRGCGL